MKNFALACLFVASAASAAENVKIVSITLAREGGGDFAAVVARSASGTVKVYTKSCSFQELTKDQQAQTMVTIEGQDALDLDMIFSNKATLASDQSIKLGLTGTFPTLYVTYEYQDSENMTKRVRRKISKPLIALESRISPVLVNIEEKARAASMAFCSAPS